MTDINDLLVRALVEQGGTPVRFGDAKVPALPSRPYQPGPDYSGILAQFAGGNGPSIGALAEALRAQQPPASTGITPPGANPVTGPVPASTGAYQGAGDAFAGMGGVPGLIGSISGSMTGNEGSTGGMSPTMAGFLQALAPSAGGAIGGALGGMPGSVAGGIGGGALAGSPLNQSAGTGVGNVFSSPFAAANAQNLGAQQQSFANTQAGLRGFQTGGQIAGLPGAVLGAAGGALGRSMFGTNYNNQAAMSGDQGISFAGVNPGMFGASISPVLQLGGPSPFATETPSLSAGLANVPTVDAPSFGTYPGGPTGSITLADMLAAATSGGFSPVGVPGAGMPTSSGYQGYGANSSGDAEHYQELMSPYYFWKQK